VAPAITGQEKVMENIRRLGKAYPKAMAAAVYKLGVVIVAGAVRRCPVEFGVLRSSAYVSPPQGEGIKANVEVGFGTKYAVPQHERLDYRHPRGGEAKYLEKSVHQVAPQSLQLLFKWIEQMITSAGVVTAGAKPTSAFNARPVVGNDNHKTRSQGARLKRAAANVRKKTGR
jgi:hypothetical protein